MLQEMFVILNFFSGREEEVLKLYYIIERDKNETGKII